MQTLGPVMRLFLIAIKMRDDDSLDQKKKKKKKLSSMPAFHSVLAVCTSSKWAALPTNRSAHIVSNIPYQLLLGSFKSPPNDLVMRNDHKDRLQYVYILIITR